MFPEMESVVPTFTALFAIVGILILAGTAAVVVLIVLNVRKVKRVGHNPLTLNADLSVRALNSALLAPEKSIEARLAELDDLLKRGVISTDEHGQARLRVLSGD
ncbi:SHOCT domain-containing protein [Cryobacterium sp. BB736]|uniref:SHOCT domain-containing protein n=1 Tax=Cryobacterium sp. BB736 TaxID=2746963 RepID=UPI0018744E24|nr:SHOCT domain-containing protein [Cryobacterium sp. BB736]